MAQAFCNPVFVSVDNGSDSVAFFPRRCVPRDGVVPSGRIAQPQGHGKGGSLGLSETVLV